MRLITIIYLLVILLILSFLGGLMFGVLMFAFKVFLGAFAVVVLYVIYKLLT